MSRSISRGVAALVTLAVLVALAVTGLWLLDDDEDSQTRETETPIPTPSRTPASIEDLPQGEPAAVPYVRGTILVVGDRRVALKERPITVVDSAFAVVMRYRDGSIVRVTKPSLRVRTLAKTSAGPPIVDPGGNVVAWQVATPSGAEVVVHSLRGTVRELDRQAFPANPTCCDNPFQVLGFSQLADLYVALPSRSRVWVWNIYEGQEGIPHAVPDSDKYVKRIRGLGDGEIDQITANEIVVRYPPQAKGEPSVYGVGTARARTYRETQRIRAVDADFNDPSARRIVYWSNDGLGHITNRTSGPGVTRDEADDPCPRPVGR